MAIRITCPGCKTILTLDDDKRGQKVRCDNTTRRRSIPAAMRSQSGEEEEMAVQNGQSVTLKSKPGRCRRRRSTRRKLRSSSKKEEKQQSGPDLTLWLVAGGAVLFLVAMVGWGGWAIYKAQKDARMPLVPKGPRAARQPPRKRSRSSAAARGSSFQAARKATRLT